MELAKTAEKHSAQDSVGVGRHHLKRDRLSSPSHSSTEPLFCQRVRFLAESLNQLAEQVRSYAWSQGAELGEGS